MVFETIQKGLPFSHHGSDSFKVLLRIGILARIPTVPRRPWSPKRPPRPRGIASGDLKPCLRWRYIGRPVLKPAPNATILDGEAWTRRYIRYLEFMPAKTARSN